VTDVGVSSDASSQSMRPFDPIGDSINESPASPALLTTAYELTIDVLTGQSA
jgi:hypothetical protein